MRRHRAWQSMPILLACAGMLSGCYYDPYTGYTYPYPPPYGYSQPPPGAPDMPQGGPAQGGPAQGGPALDGPALGGPPPGATEPGSLPSGGPSLQADVITRNQFVQRWVQRATRLQGNPQLAAQRAGAVFDQIDANHVGAVTREQIRAWQESHRRAPSQGQPPPSE
jgi:hypothetical protein